MAERGKTWKRVKFGDVVRQVKDRVDPETAGVGRYVAGEHMDTDDLRIRRWGEVGGGYLGPAFHMRFRPGQVLYGSRRTYLRKVAVADFEGICANTTFVLESADPTKLLPDFLPFVMQTENFHEHSKRESKGSVNPYVNFSDLAWYEFALPGLEEQRRIADTVQTIDETSEAVSEAAQESIRVVLSYDEDFFCTAPNSWPRLPVAHLCEFFSRRHQADDVEFDVEAGAPGAVPVLRSLNIWPGRFDLEELRFIAPEGRSVHSKLQLREGDVLIVRTGDPGRPGNAAVVSASMAGWNCIDVILARPRETILPGYLEAALNRPSSLQRLTSLAPGTKQKHLTMTDLHRLLVPVPLVRAQAAYLQRRSVLKGAVAGMSRRLETLAEVRRGALRAVEGMHVL